MNGAKVKFVEDAARLVYEQLEEESRIIDFRSSVSLNRCTRMMRWPQAVCRWGFRAEYEDFANLVV